MKNKLFINREISWLDFNYRVLDEAYDKCNLVMDRLIFGDNGIKSGRVFYGSGSRDYGSD